MHIDVFTRHSADCPHKDDRYWKRCRCRKWFYIDSSRKRIPAMTRSWQEAEAKARKMEQEAEAREKAAAIGLILPATPTSKTVRQAVEHFLANKKQAGLSKNFLQKYNRELPHFANWCETRLLDFNSITLLQLEEYRATWTGTVTTRRKRQERLRSFFKYCLRHRWVSYNVASDLEPIKGNVAPKMPLEEVEYERVLAAVDNY